MTAHRDVNARRCGAVAKGVDDCVRDFGIAHASTSPTATGPVKLLTWVRLNRKLHREDDRRLAMKILMVLTSHDTLGSTGRKTGFWLEEFAAPYFVFKDAGVDLTLASPKGGQPPIDPKSDLPENQTPAMTRFKRDAAAQKALASTVKLAEMRSEDFDTVFYPGGHGPMWDLAESPVSIALLESFYDSGKPIALVCHSPGVLRRVTYKGAPLVKGKRVTGFTNDEEEEVQLTKIVPFLVETELKRLGAVFEKVPNWQPFAITDGRLITGQNPASSTAAARALMTLMLGPEKEDRKAKDGTSGKSSVQRL
jgi:putative intracellular protease/amidase